VSNRSVLVAAGVVAALLVWLLPDSGSDPADRRGGQAGGGVTTSPVEELAEPAAPWSALEPVAGHGAWRGPSGVVVPIVAVRPDGGGYDVRTPCDRPLLVSDGEVLDGAHVVLDPGHGGDQTGAVGANGLLESDLNLAVALRAAELLRADGVTVVLTREDDLRVSLATRAAIATSLEPVAFLSIHHNAVADRADESPGTEAYYQVASADSRRLAGLVVEEVREALGAFDVAWETDEGNGARARVRSGDEATDFYGVLRRTAEGGVTGVLSEAGFLSNPAEAALFATDAGQQAEAEALARALTRFVAGEAAGDAAFSTRPPSTGAVGSAGGSNAGCVDPPLG
jgi:N-acetylmuramoyl-L-alanine amidase